MEEAAETTEVEPLEPDGPTVAETPTAVLPPLSPTPVFPDKPLGYADVDSEAGQNVVVMTIVSVVLAPIGQFVIVGGQEVIV